jgi:hypothetical protein
MKNFAILRSIPEDMTWTQVDAAAMQNMSYMGLPEDEADLAWEPKVLGVNWVRSYWEPGSSWGTCLYTARDEQAVRDWHDLCQVSYAGIQEIEIEEAPGVDDYPRGFHAPREAVPLIAVESPAQLRAPAPEEWRWIRTYRKTDSGEELKLFAPADGSSPGSLPEGFAVRRVVELRPEDYE